MQVRELELTLRVTSDSGSQSCFTRDGAMLDRALLAMQIVLGRCIYLWMVVTAARLAEALRSRYAGHNGNRDPTKFKIFMLARETGAAEQSAND